MASLPSANQDARPHLRGHHHTHLAGSRIEHDTTEVLRHQASSRSKRYTSTKSATNELSNNDREPKAMSAGHSESDVEFYMFSPGLNPSDISIIPDHHHPNISEVKRESISTAQPSKEARRSINRIASTTSLEYFSLTPRESAHEHSIAHKQPANNDTLNLPNLARNDMREFTNPDESSDDGGVPLYGELNVCVYSASIDIVDSEKENALVQQDEVFLKLMFAAIPEGSPPWRFTEIATRHVESYRSKTRKLQRGRAKSGLFADFFCEQLMEISSRQIDPWRDIVEKMRVVGGHDDIKIDGGLVMGLLLMVCRASDSLPAQPVGEHMASTLTPCFIEDCDESSNQVICVAFMPLAEIFEGENRFTSESSNGPLLLYEQPTSILTTATPRVLGTLDVSLWWNPAGTIEHLSVQSHRSRRSSVAAVDPQPPAIWKNSLGCLLSDSASCRLLLNLLQNKTYRKPLLKLLRTKSSNYRDEIHPPIPVESFFDLASGTFFVNRLQFDRAPLDSLIHSMNSHDCQVEVAPLTISIYMDIVEMDEDQMDAECILSKPFGDSPRKHRLFRPDLGNQECPPSFQGGVLLASKAEVNMEEKIDSLVVIPQVTSACKQGILFECDPKISPSTKSYMIIWTTIETKISNASGRPSMLPGRRRRRNNVEVIGYKVLEIEHPNSIGWSLLLTTSQLVIPLYSEISESRAKTSIGTLDFTMRLNE
eukprot:GHVH01011262.1.p1 GENE.GHVH01011262.1~~GHVH01011262.1.p1  ORF type:complete len:710 (+),score=94.54 GHVH01011262.1:64-2193(+)